MVRDGRDVAYERVRQNGGLESEALRKWEIKVEKNERALRMLKPESALTVQYEDLVREQRSTLQKIMVFLGLEFEETLLSYPMKADQVGIHRRSEL